MIRLLIHACKEKKGALGNTRQFNREKPQLSNILNIWSPSPDSLLHMISTADDEP